MGKCRTVFGYFTQPLPFSYLTNSAHISLYKKNARNYYKSLTKQICPVALGNHKTTLLVLVGRQKRPTCLSTEKALLSLPPPHCPHSLVGPPLDRHLAAAQMRQKDAHLLPVGRFLHADRLGPDRGDVGRKARYVPALDVHRLAAVEPAPLVPQLPILDARFRRRLRVRLSALQKKKRVASRN